MDGHTSDASGTELSHENGHSSNGFKEESVKDNLDRESASRDDSPVPGTSKSSGIHRRSSKEPKRNSPDPAEGD